MDAASSRIVTVIKKGKPASKALKECSPGLEKLYKGVISNYASEVNADVQTRIEQLLAEVTAVGDGDLRVWASVTPDTLGVVADCINYLIQELITVIIRIQRTTATVAVDTSDFSEAIKAQKVTLETIARLVEEYRAFPGSTPESVRDIVAKTEQLNTFLTEGSTRIERIRRAMDVLYESVALYRLPQVDENE
jgi:methyl-accepting chemotaxis protein